MPDIGQCNFANQLIRNEIIIYNHIIYNNILKPKHNQNPKLNPNQLLIVVQFYANCPF